MNRSKPELEPEAAEYLLNYHWPGNVRELENLIDRILVFTPHPKLTVKDLPDHIQTGRGQISPPPLGNLDLKSGIKDLEAKLIREALIQTRGNRAEAARRLNISYPSLLSKIKTYGIET